MVTCLLLSLRSSSLHPRHFNEFHGDSSPSVVHLTTFHWTHLHTSCGHDYWWILKNIRMYSNILTHGCVTSTRRVSCIGIVLGNLYDGELEVFHRGKMTKFWRGWLDFPSTFHDPTKSFPLKKNHEYHLTF